MTCDYKIDLFCISVWNLKSIFRGLNRDGVQNLGTESNIVLFKFSYLLFDIFLGTPNGIVEHSVVVLSKKLFVFFFFFFSFIVLPQVNNLSAISWQEEKHVR